MGVLFSATWDVQSPHVVFWFRLVGLDHH